MAGESVPPSDTAAEPSADHGGSAPAPRTGGAAASQETSTSQAEPSAPAVNDVLDGRYRLDSLLKKGSTGVMYAGTDRRLGIPVAVKVLRMGLLGQRQEATVKRMLQEARVAAKLSHPSLVQMLDMGTAPNGAPYLVMELLRGDSLAALLADRGRLEPVEAVQILLPVAEALAWAHEQTVVHRNVKPENVLLAASPEGGVRPKLIDFGLARADVQTRERITQRGEALGTPEYMAPEQARGEDVTASADLWAFCVTLYKLVTGEAPFQGLTHTDVLERILNVAPAPITDRGHGDAKLWAIIERGLAKDPAKRWATMSQVGTALAGWLLERGETKDVCGEAIEARWPQASTVGGSEMVATPPPSGAPRAEPKPRSSPPPTVSGLDTSEPGPAGVSERQPSRRVSPLFVFVVLALLWIIGIAWWYSRGG